MNLNPYPTCNAKFTTSTRTVIVKRNLILSLIVLQVTIPTTLWSSLTSTTTIPLSCVDAFTTTTTTTAAVIPFKRRPIPTNDFRNERTIATTSYIHSHSSSSQIYATYYDDFDGFFFPQDGNNKNQDNSQNGDDDIQDNESTKDSSLHSDASLYASLRARQASLEEQQEKEYNTGSSSSLFSSSTPSGSSSSRSKLSSSNKRSKKNNNNNNNNNNDWIQQNWKDAHCVSSVRLTLDDWIRRLAIDLYPLVVCGSARGNLYLADLESMNKGNNDNDTMKQQQQQRRRLDPNKPIISPVPGELDCLENVHASHLEESVDDTTPRKLNDALEALYGNYDGGGVIAIAAKKDWIVSSGREGGVHLCTIVGTEEDVHTGSRGGKSKQTRLQLHPLGKLRGLEEPFRDEDAVSTSLVAPPAPPLVTSLVFDNQGTLWIGGYDGILRGYDYEQTDIDDRPLMLRQKHADHEIRISSPILSVSVQDEIGCGVLTTLDQGVFMFSLDDGHILSQWNPFEQSRRGENARSASIVQTDLPQPVGDDETDNNDKFTEPILPESHWSVIVGGSKGSLYQRRLGIHARTGFISEQHPFLDEDVATTTNTLSISSAIGRGRIRPNHLGPVVAMESPSPGILVTGSHDGTMRVWDCSLYRNEDEEEEEVDIEELDDADADEDVISLEGKTDVKQLQLKRPRVLYALSGYKVWLGSMYANDRKLVSDGADNSIIVHSFDEDEEDVLRSRDDEEDDMEDISFE